MTSFDSAETDDEIVHILQNPDPSQMQSTIASPFQRWTTPRIANRKVIQDTTNKVASNNEASNNNTMGSFLDFSFAVEDLSMSQFVKADSEFFAEFNKTTDTSESPRRRDAKPEENSLDTECRSLDIHDIRDIVHASNTRRYNRDGDNPSVGSWAMDTKVKALNSSPHSVMDYDASTQSHRRVGRNLKTSSYSEAGDTRDTYDDESSSFVSSKVSYGLDSKTRIRLGKIGDVDSTGSSKQSVVENIVYSAPLARLHDFIMGNGLCCTSEGQRIIGKACSQYERKNAKDYEEEEEEDDATYDDRTFDDTTYDMGDDETSYHRRGGSSFSIESSAYYTTDDDETISRASASTRSHSYRRAVVKAIHKWVSEPPKPRASPLGGRGRSLTVRSGCNSDRSMSRGASTIHSFNSDEKHVQGTELKKDYVKSRDKDHYVKSCDSKDQSVKSNESSQVSAELSSAAESVLSQDEALWMEMTKPSPDRSANTTSTSCNESPSRKEDANVSMESTSSSFLLNLQARTASAKLSPTKAKKACCEKKALSLAVNETTLEVDGYFKVRIESLLRFNYD
jgi:hypothetical protein